MKFHENRIKYFLRDRDIRIVYSSLNKCRIEVDMFKEKENEFLLRGNEMLMTAHTDRNCVSTPCQIKIDYLLDKGSDSSVNNLNGVRLVHVC